MRGMSKAAGTALAALLLASPPLAAASSLETSWLIGTTTVAATISLPEGKGPFPGVVLVPGSGPTDRDWRSPLIPGPNGSAPLLAGELAKAGFASIRYDKRFTGPYGAANMPALLGKISFAGHAEEVAGAAARLRAQPGVDPGRVFALTNSEGAIHALNCHLAGQQRFSGLVLTGAPGRRLSEVLRSQIGAQVASMPDKDKIMAGLDALMGEFLAGKPFVPSQAVPPGVNQLIASLHQPANLPFTRELFAVDVAALAARAGVPLLVLIGKKDIQTDWRLDGKALETALSKAADVSFVYPANADHVLKHEPKPREELSAEDGLYYNAEGRKLDRETADVLTGWLKKRAAPAAPKVR